MASLRPLLDLAHGQHRVFRLDQARALGYSKPAIRHLVATERIWRAYRAVYALEGPLTPQGWTQAAVLRCEPGAYADRFTAAAVLDLATHWPDRPQISVIGAWARGPATIDVARATSLEVGRCQGIPVTSPAQTIIACARALDDRALVQLLRRAEYRGLNCADLLRPGIPRNLRALLDRYVVGSGLTASELEARFFALCASAGLPLPTVQARFPDRRRVDFVWHDKGVIVETDGRRGHQGWVAIGEDAARDRDHSCWAT